MQLKKIILLTLLTISVFCSASCKESSFASNTYVIKNYNENRNVEICKVKFLSTQNADIFSQTISQYGYNAPPYYLQYNYKTNIKFNKQQYNFIATDESGKIETFGLFSRNMEELFIANPKDIFILKETDKTENDLHDFEYWNDIHNDFSYYSSFRIKDKKIEAYSDYDKKIFYLGNIVFDKTNKNFSIVNQNGIQGFGFYSNDKKTIYCTTEAPFHLIKSKIPCDSIDIIEGLNFNTSYTDFINKYPQASKSRTIQLGRYQEYTLNDINDFFNTTFRNLTVQFQGENLVQIVEVIRGTDCINEIQNIINEYTRRFGTPDIQENIDSYNNYLNKEYIWEGELFINIICKHDNDYYDNSEDICEITFEKTGEAYHHKRK